MAYSDPNKLFTPPGLVVPGVEDQKVAAVLGGTFTASNEGGLVVVQTVLMRPAGLATNGVIEMASEIPAALKNAFASAQRNGTSVAVEAVLAANDTKPSPPKETAATQKGLYLPGSSRLLRP